MAEYSFVGSRSSTETIIAILKAFLDQRTWKQAELARACGVSAATIHKRITELRESGIPFEIDREHPHVFWSVAKTWYPGGVLFTDDQIAEMIRQLARVPASRARSDLLASLLRAMPGRTVPDGIVPPETTAREEKHLPLLEDAIAGKLALRFSYVTAARGKETSRHASLHRLLLGPPARFVATCHRSGTLKWFRVENVTEARLDPAEAFRAADPRDVDAHVRASLDGFHEGGAPARHVFFVSDPDARWVARNLLDEMHADDVPGGIRVTVETAALRQLARLVVGLGAAAKPLTSELEAAVRELAEGALRSLASGAA